jgi:hypothetical protein
VVREVGEVRGRGGDGGHGWVEEERIWVGGL